MGGECGPFDDLVPSFMKAGGVQELDLVSTG